MGEMPFNGTIVLSFAAYTLIIVLVGMRAAWFGRRDDEDYFLAGRTLGPWMAALSAGASAESAWVTMGLVGLAFKAGLQAYWLVPGLVVGYVFNWFIMAGRLRDASVRLGALTLPDFFARHFAERLPVLRMLSVVVILVAMLLYASAQMAAAGKAFDFALGGQIGYVQGVLIGAGVVLAYTIIGGFRAACWTDFLQAIVMIGALAGFPLLILLQQGGYGFVVDQLRDADPALVGWIPDGTLLAFIGFVLGAGALGVNFGYPGQPHILVRFMAMRDAGEARRAGVIAGSWMLLVVWGAITIGLCARALAEGGAAWGEGMLIFLEHGAGAEGAVDRENTLIVAAANLLPGVLAGFVLAAILAAICSTADSQLVIAASAVSSDFLVRIIRRDTTGAHPWLNRAVLMLLGIGAVLLVIDQDVNVYRYVLTYGWAVLGAAFGPQLILILLWRRATYAGCIAGMLVGFILPIAWVSVMENRIGDVEVYNLPLAFCAAMLVNVAVSIAAGRRAGPSGQAGTAR